MVWRPTGVLFARATADTREAPVTHEITPFARQWPLREDPADRILAATTQVLDLTLVSVNTRLLGFGRHQEAG
jgi:PIN domain nuclease of toxin-antitoxin system